MSDPKDIEFRLKTTADTAGAEQAALAITTAGDAAKTVNVEAGKSTEDLKQNLDDLKKRTEALNQETQDFRESQEKVNTALNVGRAAMVGVGTGGAIVSAIFKEIGQAINSIDIDHLRELNSEMAQQVQEVQGWAQVLTDPINGIQNLLSGTTLGEAFGGMNTQLQLNAENAVRVAKVIADARLKAATDNQTEITSAYDVETKALVKQKEELERIIGLRQKLASLASEGLGQEVEAAKIRGGDVELAKSNELAAKLQQGLQDLGGTLQRADAERATAQAGFNEAVSKYNQGVQDGLQKLDPDLLGSLAAKVDAAKDQLDSADQALTDQKAIFATAKANLLRGVENELASLETEGTQTASDAAQKVRDNVYESIKQEVALLGQDTTKAVNETFAKLRENQQKANDGIVSNTGELIELVKSLGLTVAAQSGEIQNLKAQVQGLR